jgi:murein L,D-transpeptidase YcbB/YkuD
MRSLSRACRAWLAGLLLALATGPALAAATAAAIEARVATLADGRGGYVRGLPVASGDLLPRFYAARGYAPAWSDPARVAELLDLLATAPAHGLATVDYNLDTLRALWAGGAVAADPAAAADLDLLLTESLVRFGYHQRFGKVNPKRLEPDWNFSRRYRAGQDPLSTLAAAVAAPSLGGFLADWVQRQPLYPVLQQKLAEYRGIAARGGWPEVPAGATLRVGDRDARVAVLRERLRVTGDLAAEAPAPVFADLFDAPLLVAVQAFQERHALAADGIVGPGTLAALNVPVAARIDQLRLTLERARWVGDDTPGEVVVVNIAGAEVFVARDGVVTWWRRAVVGKEARQTPVFRGTMSYLELNPTWTIPPTILRQDVLPKVRRDRGYLAANHIRVLDLKGRPVDPGAVDWNARSFPYVLRQDAGPDNPLGLIKLMFPNRHDVYLHDTPARASIFAQSRRTFSSGCIRVEDPFELAAIVLDEPERWTAASLRASLADGKTRRVSLKRPWPVLLLYWTAALDARGRVRFLPDVYGRDPAVLAALDGDVRLEFPAE